MYSNFVKDCLNGDAVIIDIDKYIEYWHENNVDSDLDAFLGFTEPEYEKWLQEGNGVIRDILYCRNYGLDYLEYYQMPPEEKIAARSYKLEDIEDYRKHAKS